MFKMPGAQMFDWRRTLAAGTADGWSRRLESVLKRVLVNDPYDQESSRAAPQAALRPNKKSSNDSVEFD